MVERDFVKKNRTVMGGMCKNILDFEVCVEREIADVPLLMRRRQIYRKE